MSILACFEQILEGKKATFSQTSEFRKEALIRLLLMEAMQDFIFP